MNPNVSGLLAIAMWSLLALLTVASGTVPPLQLLAMTFFIGGLSGAVTWIFRGFPTELTGLPWRMWLFGIAGLFGYHFFYYTALRNAPAAQAGLIAYLWPMLIVVGSALLPGEKLRWYHLAGTLLGFGGAAILLAGDGNLFALSGSAFGYLSAFACAFIWSAYSIYSRTMKAAPVDCVAIYCLASAVLALICHLLFETTVWPRTSGEWLAIAGLGLMPVGLAFYAWDYGMKHGNIQLLGGASYLAPLASTLILTIAGFAEPHWQLFVACVMIIAGAVVCSGKFRI
ncbi:MAG: EamA family transporter [Pseudomonadota bacterium]